MENTFGIDINPDNDEQRIEALKRYKILDTPPEGAFNNVAKLATQIFKVPISLISLVDAEQVFLKANIGMGNAKVTSRGVSLCSLAVLKSEVTVFENAPEEPCLLVNPNVAGKFGLKFYAGAPLTTHDGFRIGTLCVIDKTPRNFTEEDELILAGLAKIVMDEIELRLAAITETENLQDANEELSTTIEELSATNEELTATIEDLEDSKENLHVTNKELAKSEAKLRSIFEQDPSGIAILKGRELIIDSANQEILRIWGKDESVIQKPLHIGLPELKGQPFLTILDEVYTSGVAFKGYEVKVMLEHDGILKDGFYNFVYQPLKDAMGETHSILVVATSVTEQVDARNTVNDINERLELALDAGTLGSYDLDMRTGLMSSSKQCKANYGLEQHADFNFPDLLNVILPDYREYVNEQVNIAIINNTIYQVEYQVSWPDGSRHWISAYGKPRYDDEGVVNHMVGVTQNITERKVYEQRKDDFLSVVSHELKTPITSLKASLQLLNRMKFESVNPMMPRLIESSAKSVEKINNLVDDLLDMSRFGEGQLRLEKSTFTIWEMLNLCCNHVRIAGTHELIIEGDESLQIYADEHRIDQVVVNFVNNAVKYAADSKHIYLIISKKDKYAKIAVKDFGLGIPADQIPYLFDRYWRANHAGAKYSGLGLGLYICAEIIKRHGGEIGVDTEIGKGSTFWLTVPLVTE